MESVVEHDADVVAAFEAEIARIKRPTGSGVLHCDDVKVVPMQPSGALNG